MLKGRHQKKLNGVSQCMDLFEVLDLCDEIADSNGSPAPAELAPAPPPDPLADWPHRELLEFVVDTFRNYLPAQQDRLRARAAGVAHAHEVMLRPLGLQPSRYAEDVALLCLQTRLRDEWPEKDRVKVTPRTGPCGQPVEGFPDIQVWRDGEVIIGVEIKSYEVTCKERMPTARFQVSESACQPQDLVVIIPWIWKRLWPDEGNIHILPSPLVEPCHRVIRSRDAAWRHKGRPMQAQKGLDPRQLGVQDRINVDTQGVDGGNNFGRVGRIPLVKEWVNGLMMTRYAPEGWPKKQLVSVLWSVLWGDF